MAIKDLTQIEKHLFLCNGGSCKAKGAEETTTMLRSIISELDLSESVHTTKTLCNGRCKDGPIIISQPEGLWFKQITPDKVRSFVRSFLLYNSAQKSLRLFKYGETRIESEGQEPENK